MRWSWNVFTAILCLAQTAVAKPDAKDGIKSVPLRTHSLAPPYLDQDLQSRWFDWGGDTVIRADQYVRLTSDRQHQAGYLWSRLPLTATNWEIEWEFKVHGTGNLYGDGMALWITKQRALPGPVFGSIDNFEGLGIFLDTYKNNRPGVVFPYISAMLGDGQTSYDHAHDGKENELAGCSARGIRGANIPTRAKLTYFQENYLQLDLQYKNVDQWVQCFNAPNVTLPQVAYLGFSAHCGELSDNHDIISITANNLYSANPNRPGPGRSDKPRKSTKTPKGYKEPTEGGSWMWFFLKCLIFITVVAGAYVGWVAYRTQRRSSRF
ncbi:legume-like lectin family-domain-containing protein [Tricharina praecox]|uniref:legume-like lectin family-domain-containing protein n=1 Tax=Tricharina praecox TaxID=43433 RepID=UPI00221FE9E2|nr:legume-like lectin family-domain-containing protein [Tricharina praecox]KAI5849060.1 legume-like lectin family-domain-containing protein [Tricharina praecox]